MEFYFTPELTIPAGGTIELQCPDSVKVHTIGIACYDSVNFVACDVSARNGVITITTSEELRAAVQQQFSLTDTIDNPISTEPTESFQILTSAGETET